MTHGCCNPERIYMSKGQDKKKAVKKPKKIVKK
jgi:hypothetical protein